MLLWNLRNDKSFALQNVHEFLLAFDNSFVLHTAGIMLTVSNTNGEGKQHENKDV